MTMSYKPIQDLVNEISTAYDVGATVAALSMVYIGIDTFAWLSLPLERDRQTRNDFYEWVDTYLKTEDEQPYQYVGKDLYAARCAVLHTFATLADLHKKVPAPKKFGYVDNGPHQHDGGDLVLISVAVLIRDFGSATQRFLQAIQADASLKKRVESRLDQLLNATPIQRS
ncbi:MAG: hypothetical protein QM709_12265 [Spongiibacteraceae bacterium]